MKKYADFAMYQVKRTQKGELAEFDPEIYRKEAVATEKRQQFQKLIREELVRYYFQPIISGKTGETIAYEALMRVSLPMITNPGQVMELAGRRAASMRLSVSRCLNPPRAIFSWSGRA